MKELTPHIAIALCTYNGAAFLHEQLQSIVRQTHENWSLWVSDDGSTDGTWDILLAFQRDYGDAHDIRLLRGPGEGSCRNFLSLLCHPDFPHGYVALADQDDVWLKGKLARAVQMMRKTPHGCVLYGAQSFHVAQNLQILGRSRQPRHPPSFANAVVQNVVGGHSMVLSPVALQLVRRIGCQHKIPFHDWWIYQLVSGVGGKVVLDRRPVLLYRQHDTNVIGAHRGVTALTARVNALRAQTYKRWVATNMDVLWHHRGILNPEARAKVDAFQNTRVSRGARRAAFLRALGLKRQAALGTLALYLAGALGWA